MLKKKGGILINRAEVQDGSINKEAKTFDVVFASETPVYRSPWWSDESFNEILVIDKKSIRSERLDLGVVPLLDNHSGWMGINNQYGAVRNWRIENGMAMATVQYSAQASKADVWSDIESGVIRSISVGAKVYQYEIVRDKDPKKTPTYRAVDWEPMEISLVPMGADPNASVQRKESDEFEISFIDNTKRGGMGTENEDVIVAERKRMNGIMELCREANLGHEFQSDLVLRGVTVDEARTAIAAEVAKPKALSADDIARAVELENKRCAEIRTIARGLQLDEAFIDGLVTRKVDGKLLTLDQARAEMIEKRAAADKGPAGGGCGPVARGDELDGIKNAMVEGLMHRVNPGSVERSYNLDDATKGRKMDVKAHDYKHSSYLDICRALLQYQGVINVQQMSKSELVTRALDTTDLPDLFTSTVKRFLRMYYEPIVPEWMMFSKNVPADDFRLKTGVKFDAAVTFEELDENGEYKEANMMSDEKATIQLQTFARMFSITRQSIINDDLGVLTDIPRGIGIGARQFQSKKVWGLITGNAACPDGNTLFHAKHGNWATGTSASAINDASLSNGRTAMRRQKSPQGNELLITPKFLVVPPELETTAQKFLREIFPTNVSAVNLWSSLEPFVNVYFANTQQWYMVADPATTTVDGIVHSYLTGQEGLFTESYIEKKSDKLVIKSRLDFAASVWGWQGWYRNDGASVVA